MLKINFKETTQKRNNLNLLPQKSIFSELKYCQTWHSRSFELPSNSMLQSNQQYIRQLPKLKTNFNITNTSYLLQSERRSCRYEKVDIADVVTSTILENPVINSIFRRVSQYEFIGSKQKRLNNLIPSIQVFQHQKDAAIEKKKKMNRLKMQQKFSQRSNHKKHYRHYISRSGRLPTILKITHKRAKTNCDIKYDGPIIKLEPDLERKINLLLQRNRITHRILRRRTFIQEPKNSGFVSKDKLLKDHEIMDKKFDQFESSCESSPAAISKVQFKKTQFSKLQLINSGNHQILTPRLHHEQNNNIFTRKSSHSVIAQYVIEKTKKIKNIFELKLPDIIQPNLNELNQYFLAQKKSVEISKTTQQLIQSKSQDNLTNQIRLNSRQSQFINKQLKIIKQDSQICNSIRIKTLPSDTTISRNKINLQQKLWPYFQKLK